MTTICWTLQLNTCFFKCISFAEIVIHYLYLINVCSNVCGILELLAACEN